MAGISGVGRIGAGTEGTNWGRMIASMPVVSNEHRVGVQGKILAAAVEVMREHGVRGTTTRAVQEAAGVSAGTIYNYFPSATALTAAAAKVIAREDWESSLREIDQPDGPGLRQLVEQLVVGTEREQADRVRSTQLRLNAEPGTEDTDSVVEYNRFVIDTTASTVAEAQQSGLIDQSLDPAAFAELLDMVRDAMSIRAGQGSYATSHERVGRVLTQILEHVTLD